MHVRFGFGLIQKDFHNMSSKEYSGLNKLAFDFASNLLNLNGQGGGKSINPLTAFQTIKKANDETIKSMLKTTCNSKSDSTSNNGLVQVEVLDLSSKKSDSISIVMKPSFKFHKKMLLQVLVEIQNLLFQLHINSIRYSYE